MTVNNITENNFFSHSIGEDGIVSLVINMKDYSTNLFTTEFIKIYFKTIKDLVLKKEVIGLIVMSGKKEFMPGADINELMESSVDSSNFLKSLLEFHRDVDEIEKIGKPIVSIINGYTLGGGYEFALTTHYRIAIDGNYKIGLPETMLGVFPGGGGTIKLTRKLGIEKGLEIILQAQTFIPKLALEKELIDKLVYTHEEALQKAKEWIISNPKAEQAWADGKKIPGGGLKSTEGYNTMVGLIGRLRKKTHGNYPCLNNVLSAVHDGIDLPLNRALEVEARYFAATISAKEAISMMRTNFFGINYAKKGKNKPKGYDTKHIRNLGIIGGGMMGAGIAYVSAKAGIEVMIKDITIELAEKGKSYSEKLIVNQIAKGFISTERGEDLLNRIHTTDTTARLKNCDLIIEAVFEDPDLKARVTKKSQKYLKSDGFFASNTSTLPITTLAKAFKHSSKFIGLHFFSPVDKMPLLEIILGEKTSKETLSNAIDFAVQIDKIPIVVNDSQGFFTSRVFGKYTLEAVTMLLEGVSPILIENLAKQCGLAVGPLAVMDEVSLELIMNILKQNPNLQTSEEKMLELITKMIKHGRKGKKVGKGFYDYPEGEKKIIWKNEFLPSTGSDISNEDIKKRLLYSMALDSYRCLDEGVLNKTIDGDIGSILGFGYPPQTGGVFSHIDQLGLHQFVADCDRFVKYSEQWVVPKSLRKLAEENFAFYSGINSNWKTNK